MNIKHNTTADNIIADYLRWRESQIMSLLRKWYEFKKVARKV